MPEWTDDQKRAIRELREHFTEHRAEEGECGYCDLWRAWMRQDIKSLDEVIERHGIEEAPPDVPTDLLDRLREIRSEWGEGDWTSEGLE